MDIETVIAQASIQQLINRYAQAADAQDVPALAACFAPDGHFELNGGEMVLHGRDAILDTLGASPSTVGTSAHLMCNTVIDVSGPTAHAETTAVSYVLPRDTGRVLMRGLHYSDDFVQLDGDWLIAKRLHRCDWQSDLPAGPPPGMAAVMRGAPSS